MPTYEYACTQCANRFEVFQSIKDDPIAHCDKCGGKAKRLISAGAGIIFKGSGFYVNDYKSCSSSSMSSSGGCGGSDACASCSAGKTE